MILLAGSEYPSNTNELTAAIRTGLAMVLKAEPQATVALAGTLPALDSAEINLDGVAINTQARPDLHSAGAKGGTVSVKRLHVGGKRVRIESATGDFDISATGAQFIFDRNRAGQPMLKLTSAASGSFNGSIAKSDLESAILAVAREPAADHGVTLKKVELSFTQSNDKSAAIVATITASKLFMTVALRFSGEAAIDDQLNATLSNLRCTGEGVIGSAVSGFVGPQLAKVEGKQFPLANFMLGGVSLRSARLKVSGPILSASAEFGAG